MTNTGSQWHSDIQMILAIATTRLKHRAFSNRLRHRAHPNKLISNWLRSWRHLSTISLPSMTTLHLLLRRRALQKPLLVQQPLCKQTLRGTIGTTYISTGSSCILALHFFDRQQCCCYCAGELRQSVAKGAVLIAQASQQTKHAAGIRL